jgi:hypothetical protein
VNDAFACHTNSLTRQERLWSTFNVNFQRGAACVDWLVGGGWVARGNIFKVISKSLMRLMRSRNSKTFLGAQQGTPTSYWKNVNPCPTLVWILVNERLTGFTTNTLKFYKFFFSLITFTEAPSFLYIWDIISVVFNLWIFNLSLDERRLGGLVRSRLKVTFKINQSSM